MYRLYVNSHGLYTGFRKYSYYRYTLDDMRHYVYRIDIPGTDLYYIGKHSTTKSFEKDRYLGSGTEIIKYKQRIKTILYECNTSDDAYDMEKIILGDKWKTDTLCLNQKPGGKGAPVGEDHHWFGKPSAYDKSGSEHHAFGKERSTEICAKISAGQRARSPESYPRGNNHHGFGKERTVEVCTKISVSKTGKKLGAQSAEHSTKISHALRGLIKTQEHCENLSKSRLGKTYKQKNPTVQGSCIHCRKQMDTRNLLKYHGDKCKLNQFVPNTSC